MNRREFLKTTSLLTGALAWSLETRPETAARQIQSYRVGERVSSDVFVLDAEGAPVTLASQVNAYTKILYLFIFGGALRSKPSDRRGQLWCSDSLDDLAIQRTLYYNYAGKGVTFVPVATPPVYDAARYGYEPGVFLTAPEESSRYHQAVREFIERTEALKGDNTLPFDPVFYDPRFRLLDNPMEHEHAPAYGEVHPWQGRFKWHEDHQRYGTPTIWLLSPELEVLREPFFGNVYEGVPLSIRYTVRDVAGALDRLLSR